MLGNSCAALSWVRYSAWLVKQMSVVFCLCLQALQALVSGYKWSLGGFNEAISWNVTVLDSGALQLHPQPGDLTLSPEWGSASTGHLLCWGPGRPGRPEQSEHNSFGILWTLLAPSRLSFSARPAVICNLLSITTFAVNPELNLVHCWSFWLATALPYTGSLSIV